MDAVAQNNWKTKLGYVFLVDFDEFVMNLTFISVANSYPP